MSRKRLRSGGDERRREETRERKDRIEEREERRGEGRLTGVSVPFSSSLITSPGSSWRRLQFQRCYYSGQLKGTLVGVVRASDTAETVRGGGVGMRRKDRKGLRGLGGS